MINVANKKIINKLSIRSFVASKKRNMIAIIAIALTTILFTSLFTIGIGMKEAFQNQTVRQSGGDGHVVFKYINDEQHIAVKNHPLISEISYDKIAADSVDNQKLLKRHTEMYYMDKTAMKLGFCEPTVGRPAIEENEVVADTATLDLLGVPHEVGAVVPIEYTIQDKKMKKNFILSGYYESDPVFNVGFILVSEAFCKAHAEYYDNNMSYAGKINAYIMFKNSMNLEEKAIRVIEESGYTKADDGSIQEPSDIKFNVNWAYLSSNYSDMDPGTMMSLIAAVGLIILTGYLIIYNIFQISVMKDIRYYGLLKTIGMTSKQIKRIVLRQGLMLSVLGIPVGLVGGFWIGKAVLPMIIAQVNITGGNIEVSLNPIIFAGASVFSFFTVLISVRKPGKTASKVSPIEAVRYSGVVSGKKKKKKSTNGGKIHKMALSNLGRDKKRTVLTVVSITLSLVLFNCVFTLSQGFDMDKYIGKFVDTDFLIGHANYFNQNHFRLIDDELSESFIQAVQDQDGFSEGGRLYKNIYVGDCSIERENPNEMSRFGHPVNIAEDGMPMLDLYGVEDLVLSRMDVLEGELDQEKLKTGKYIIEGVASDDYGKAIDASSHYEIGDKVVVYVDGVTYEYEVIAKVKVKSYTQTNRTSSDFLMYLPSEEYLNVVTRPVLMAYAFNVKNDKVSSMEVFIKNYTEKVESIMDYESKKVFVDDFKSFQNMLITIGGILSFIVGLIGVLNFFNSNMTSVFTRYQEFAMLQSLGMTKKQLLKVLIYEGLYYCGATIVLSFAMGVIFSFVVIDGIVSNLWFFSYQFVIWPLLLTYPVLIILSIIIPYIGYYGMSKLSIVERLRAVE